MNDIMADNNSHAAGTKGKKGNKRKPKVKFPNRVKTGAIEKKEISNLESRYKSVDVSSIKTFKDLPLSKKTQQGLQENKYVVPTKVQQESVLLALSGLDVLGAAETGSGKTLAFLIPVLERLYCKQWTALDGLGALIITPTRELALQIFDTFKKVGHLHDFSLGLIIGGKDLSFERKRLHRCNIMICTPGRLLHHMNENPLFDGSRLEMLIIDEADRCLDPGFKDDLNGILENLPSERQTLLFSATQTKSVKDLARLSLKNPVYVSVHEHAKYSTPSCLQQCYMKVKAQEKIDVLWSFLKCHKRKKIIVFLTTCKQVRFIHLAFFRLRPGFSVLALHGGMHQMKRMSVYEQFCEEESAVLFATDIAARGLDFPSVDWVVQMDCPDDVSSYIHRAGRTARNDQKGDALLMLLPSEEAMVAHMIEKKIPITEIQVNHDRLYTIQRKLESMLAKDTELKEVAQRSYVTYCKSIHLMKDKSVFDIQKLDLDALARSMGLSKAPRIRFYEKFLGKNPTASVEAAPQQPGAWRSNAEEGAFTFFDDEENNAEENDDDSDDDIMKLKRKDHDVEQGPDDEFAEEKKKKEKHLTKEQAAKRIIRKNLTANKITNFDEEGNRIFDPTREKVSDVARALELEESSVSGINIEANRLAMMEEDKVDKERHRLKIRAKHREERLKAKEERRQQSQRPQEVADNSGEDDAEESDGDDDDDDESLDGSVADIIDDLPDPDRIYGHKDDDDEDFYTGPTGPLPPKRAQMSESEDEDDSGDEDSEESEPPVPRKRSQPSDSEYSSDEEPEPSTKRSKANHVEEAAEKKTKWTRPKGPKKAKLANKPKQFDTGLDLALDEELALHLLGSKH